MSNRNINDLNKALLKNLRTNKVAFPKEHDNGHVYERLTQKHQKVLENKTPVGIAFNILNELSEWHLYYAQYVLNIGNNGHEFKSEFSKSSAYGFLAFQAGDDAYGCLPKNQFLLMNTATRYMAQSINCGWWSEAYVIADIMIESINFGYERIDGREIQKIIGPGGGDMPASWFILELYCQAEKKQFNRENAQYPQVMTPYQQALENWDTVDLSLINTLIYNLADFHISQTKEETNDIDYYEFGRMKVWLFPYEIITWLKFREKVGLPNPKEFEHPLMNLPMAKALMDFKTPLNKPKDLPFAKNLLVKLQESCPKVMLDPEFFSL